MIGPGRCRIRGSVATGRRHRRCLQAFFCCKHAEKKIEFYCMSAIVDSTARWMRAPGFAPEIFSVFLWLISMGRLLECSRLSTRSAMRSPPNRKPKLNISDSAVQGAEPGCNGRRAFPTTDAGTRTSGVRLHKTGRRNSHLLRIAGVPLLGQAS